MRNSAQMVDDWLNSLTHNFAAYISQPSHNLPSRRSKHKCLLCLHNFIRLALCTCGFWQRSFIFSQYCEVAKCRAPFRCSGVSVKYSREKSGEQKSGDCDQQLCNMSHSSASKINKLWRLHGFPHTKSKNAKTDHDCAELPKLQPNTSYSQCSEINMK